MTTGVAVARPAMPPGLTSLMSFDEASERVLDHLRTLIPPQLLVGDRL